MSVDFGFAEKFPQKWMNKSKYFPSKIGDRPSFLVLNPILGPEQLSCKKCEKTMRFLLQLYAPIDSNDKAFHRQLLVFACGRGEQCSNQFSVFRCQLPRDNQFYSYDPPDYDQDSKEYDPNSEQFDITLCPVCGINATKQCSRCKKAKYCSREHQVLHWKKGGHKQNCLQQQNETDFGKQYENILFPEFEIVIEDGNNEDDTSHKEEDNEISQENEMKKYRDFLVKNKPTFQDENLEPYVDEKNDDEQKVFDKFKKETIRGEIIRYNTDWHQQNDDSIEKILWISNKNRLKNENVPICENCGSKRKFEFQIMPSLLNKILVNKNQIDHLDWGTLVVFSCPNSCVKNLSNESKNPLDFYQLEFIFNQSL